MHLEHSRARESLHRCCHRIDHEVTAHRLVLIVATTDTSWMARARCVGMDPAVFLPESVNGRGPQPKPTRALAVCGRCQVTAECLAYARGNHEKRGVWGGQLFTSAPRQHHAAGSNGKAVDSAPSLAANATRPLREVVVVDVPVVVRRPPPSKPPKPRPKMPRYQVQVDPDWASTVIEARAKMAT